MTSPKFKSCKEPGSLVLITGKVEAELVQLVVLSLLFCVAHMLPSEKSRGSTSIRLRNNWKCIN